MVAEMLPCERYVSRRYAVSVSRKSSSIRVSHVAPGPSVLVFPGELVWMNVAPFPLSSIFSRSITSFEGSCLVYASTLAPKSAITWSEMTSTDSAWK